MTFPPVLVLTDRLATAAAGHDLVEVVEGLGGLPVAVVFREKDLRGVARAALGEAVAAAARRAEVPLLVAGDPTLARALGAAGVHLAAGDPLPVDRVGRVGRSCHDAAELARAAREGVDHVTLSPVYESPAKPGYGPPLGLGRLAELAATAGVPVYALGGITADRVEGCLRAGAAGVAVQGAVMAAADPVAAGRQVAAGATGATNQETAP